jgi:ribosome biogenesis GTPase / thiamine phosphate phosphatase
VVALNKADVCGDVAEHVAAVAEVAPDVTLLPMSAKTGEGLAALLPFLGPGQTVGLLGSSGVGKSTLLNRVLGVEVMETGETRDDGRGRHTTTRRELVRLPSGGCVIDTPGLREVQLWEAKAGIAKAFDDVEAFAAACRFGNCQHDAEPDCAVKAALESGALAEDRYEAWVQLHAELATVGIRGPGVSKRRERVGKGRRR